MASKNITIELKNQKIILSYKDFKSFIKDLKKEIGVFDSIYYLENTNNFYDYIIEYLLENCDYNIDDNEEIKNKEEIKKEIIKIIHW